VSEFILIFKRVVRVGATLFLLSVSGCLIARFGFRVPLDDLSVAVAVPVFWIFAISRVLVLVLPETKDAAAIPQQGTLPFEIHKRPDPPVIATGIGLATIFLSAVAAIDFLLSAGTFSLLELYPLAHGTIRLATLSAILCAVIVFLFCAAIVRQYVTARANTLIVGVWQILSFPARFADALRYLPKIDQHQH